MEKRPGVSYPVPNVDLAYSLCLGLAKSLTSDE
jgi:hypothetical protein